MLHHLQCSLLEHRSAGSESNNHVDAANNAEEMIECIF